MDEKDNGITIKNLIEYIEALEELVKDTGDKGLWLFRGQANKYWPLLPSIYREPCWRKNEDTMIHDIISSYPNDFPQQRSAFEKLTVMQHYGLPTRLLDVTENPLVALYFACQGDSTDNGKVFVFDIPKSDIKYSDSDTVSVVANLAWLPKDLKLVPDDITSVKSVIDKFTSVQYGMGDQKGLASILAGLAAQEKLPELKDAIGSLNDNLKELSLTIKKIRIRNKRKHTSILRYDELKDFLDKLEKVLTDRKNMIKELHMGVQKVKNAQNQPGVLAGYEELKELENSVFKSINHFKVAFNSIIETTFNNLEGTKKLLHCIRNEKPHFEPKIVPNHINSILCVKPRINNERIKRQQGAFLLYGNNKLFNAENNLKKILSDNGISTKREFIIDRGSKKAILKLLSKIGIDETTLFPGLETTAKAIKERYIGGGGLLKFCVRCQ